MPSEYFEKVFEELKKEVSNAIDSGMTLEELGSESNLCKNAARKLPTSKRVKYAYYKMCLTSALSGRTPAQLLEEDGSEKICRLFAKKIYKTQEDIEAFTQHCKQELERKRSFEEIISEYEFEE